MGMHFGNLGVRVRGVIQYSLSPHEQRAFAGAIKHGVPNLARRFAHQFFRVAPRKCKNISDVYSTVNQQMFAAINVCGLANQNILLLLIFAFFAGVQLDGKQYFTV